MTRHRFSHFTKAHLLCLFAIVSTFVTYQTAAAQRSAPIRVPSAMSPESTISPQTKQNMELPSRKHKLSWNPGDTIYELPNVEVAQIGARAPNQIGVNRDVHISIRSHGRRYRNSDGSEIRLLSIRSTGAVGIRIHFEAFDLPEGDEVFIYGAAVDGEVLGPYRAKGPWDIREFWSPTVDGDTAVIEYYSKKGKGDFQASHLSHIYVSPDSLITPQVLSCQVDASCFSNSEKNTVGRIVFVDGGSAFVCSGTLLNDRNTTLTPYFLTANHCVSSQTVAQTVETYWFYQTTSCNSGVLRSGIYHSVSGSNLLVTNKAGDSTLLRILGTLPGGLWFSGWDPDPKTTGLLTFGFHHPGTGSPPSTTSYLRRSDGSIVSTTSSCSASGLTSAYQINWTSGITEPGSSGSGLWYTSQGSSYLIGVDSCGPVNVDCNFNGNSFAIYGKFSNFYPLIQAYIDPQSGITIGQGAPNPQLFIDAANRNNFLQFAKQPPTTAVHRWNCTTCDSGNSTWGKGLIQDFDDVTPGVHDALMLADTNTSFVAQIYGGMWDKFTQLGDVNYNSANTRMLGYPIADRNCSDFNATCFTDSELISPFGTWYHYQRFQGGALVQHRTGSRNGQTYEVHGAIRARWQTLGGPSSGSYGLPITDEYASNGKRRSDFEGGSICYNPSTNQTEDGCVSTYTITLSAAPSAGGTVGGGGTFTGGTSRTVTATANSGYAFTNWTESGNVVSSSASYTFTLNSNRTLVANFSQANYTITVSASPSAGGTVGGGGTFAAGTSRTVTASANNGYTFSNWRENGTVVSSSASYTFTLNSNRTLVANFTAVNYTIAVSASPSAGGTVGGGGTFAAGSSRTVTASANSGYTFTNWTESGSVVSSSASYSFILNSNRTLVANFTNNPTTISVVVQSNPSGRSFTVDGVTYTTAQTFNTWTSGSNHTISTTSPQSGGTGTQYVWSGWNDGGAISHNVAPTGNATYTANFTTQYFLTMNAGSGGTVSPPSGYYNSGQSVSISASGNIGFAFSSWSGSGSGSFSGTSNPASVTMNGPISETASFAANKPPDVTTSAASSITTGSAILNGAINPNGALTAAWFEWGTSMTLSEVTIQQVVGAGTSALTFNDTIRVLLPNTTYFYRLAGSNGIGTTRGAIQSFTTQSLAVDWPSLGGTIDKLTVGRNADGRLEVFARGRDGAAWHRSQKGPSSTEWNDWESLGGSVDLLSVTNNSDGRLDMFARGSDGAVWHRSQKAPNSDLWNDWATLGGWVDLLSVARNADGRLEIFGRAHDGALWHRSQRVVNSDVWNDWESLGGGISLLSVNTNADGRLEVFVRGTDGALWHRSRKALNSDDWNDWATLGGNISLLSVANNIDGRLDVFARGSDGAVWHRSQKAANSDSWNDWATLGAWVDRLAVGRNGDGCLEVFARGSNGAVWHRWQNEAGVDNWSGWSSLGSWADLLTVAANANGRLQLFISGSDKSLRHIRQPGPDSIYWTDWSALGGRIDRLANANNQDGRLELFGRGADGAAWHRSQKAPGSNEWTDWATLGGSTDLLAAISNADGRLELFGRGSDGAVWHRSQKAPNSDLWHDWASLGASVDRLVAGKSADGRIELFVRGADGALWHRSQKSANSDLWNDWETLGGSIDLPSVINNADGRLEIFVRGSDGAVWHRSQQLPNSDLWNDWATLGGTIDQLSLTSNQDGRLEVFARGLDGALWHRSQKAPNSDLWNDWASLGGGIDRLAVARNQDGRVEVFVRGTDGAVWHRWQAITGMDTWVGWSSLTSQIDLLSIGSNFDGRLEIFVTAAGNGVWHKWQTVAGRW